jgi:GH24 family phage-related lysozyme (muramidase)
LPALLTSLITAAVTCGTFSASAQATTVKKTPARQLPAKLTLSVAGTAFISEFEGFRSTPYRDSAGNCLIGYGHLLHSGVCTGADSRQWGTMTVAHGRALLRSDVNSRFVPAVRAAIPATPLSQAEFDALIDWAYNVGTASIGNSATSVHAALTATPPQYTAIPADLLKYVNSGGRPLCGLYQRRASEGNLWTRGSYARLAPACPAGYR